jgi:hypothetical protein
MTRQRDWEQDVANRQRNVVFPDTVLNEGRFYRNIFQRKAPLSLPQKIGVFLLGALNVAVSLFLLEGAISEIKENGWASFVWAYESLCCLLILAFGVLLLSRAITAKSVRSTKQKLHDSQHPFKF